MRIGIFIQIQQTQESMLKTGIGPHYAEGLYSLIIFWWSNEWKIAIHVQLIPSSLLEANMHFSGFCLLLSGKE